MKSSELHALLEALHPDSFGWALLCCARERGHAETALQAVYVKILSGRAVFEGKSSFKTWLFGVIKRTAAEQRRRRLLSRLRLVSLDDVDEYDAVEKAGRNPTSGDSLAGAEQAQDLRAYRNEVQRVFSIELAALPNRQREVLHLVFYQDLTLAEAAEIMGVSVGSARTHYDRGKRRLKAKLIARGVTSNAGLER